MKVRCPNCPNVILEFTQFVKPEYLKTVRCGNCGIFATQFFDEKGVTYFSYFLASIQEMRDESKAAKSRIKSCPKKRNRRMQEWKTSTIVKTNPEVQGEDDKV